MSLARGRGLAVRVLIAVVLLLDIAALNATGFAASAAEIARYQPMPPPPLSADAVFVKDLTSDTELLALNPDTPLPPASLTKIVSALVILERANFDDVVEIAEVDLVDPTESQVGLVAGDRLTVRDLFVGMLVPSGNDATLALARHIGEGILGDGASPKETVAQFVALMNETAHDLGATTAHFANPTGIDADGHVMSARDIATVATAALEDPFFAETVNTTNAVLPSEVRPDGYPIQTTNLLLLEGAVNGVKTGTSEKAGGCLVTTYLVGSNEVLTVVLGSDVATTADGFPDNTARFAETRALFDTIQADYVWLDPAAPGVVAGLLDELLVWDASLAPNTLLPVPAESSGSLRYRLVLEPPTEPQASAGMVQFYIGETLLTEQPALQAN
jgi:D-alanyl-D-alanine carboxypeptidase (penicillin-binding protein 5/6)